MGIEKIFIDEAKKALRRLTPGLFEIIVLCPLGYVYGAFEDLDVGCPQRLVLAVDGACAAPYNGARVAHALAFG